MNSSACQSNTSPQCGPVIFSSYRNDRYLNACWKTQIACSHAWLSQGPHAFFWIWNNTDQFCMVFWTSTYIILALRHQFKGKLFPLLEKIPVVYLEDYITIRHILLQLWSCHKVPVDQRVNNLDATWKCLPKETHKYKFDSCT